MNERNRITSIDITRGIVMIIMALDHTRGLLHIDSLSQTPTDLSTTTPLLFFTRWITHLCAPTFVFLAGTSVYLALKNQTSISESRIFLVKRGLWLIFLEFSFVNFGVFFDLGFHTLLFEVIAAIGVSLILLSLLLKSSLKVVASLGVGILVLHNLFPLIPFPDNSLLKTVLSPLFSFSFFPLSEQISLIISYPPIPWLGIMLVGFASGKLFEFSTIKRKNMFLKIGVSLVLFFVLLRFSNVYGDPVAWATKQDPMFTFLSFMNVTKSPPSLLFCSVTLGCMFLILAIAEHAKGWLMNIAAHYGKAALFYFLVHFYLIHIILIGMLFMQGFSWEELNFSALTFGRPTGMQSGVSLWLVYSIWIAVVGALYIPCRWFVTYKTNHKQWWLRYL